MNMGVITFNELRRIKDQLPDGSMEVIASKLGITADTVRNYFGGSHYKDGQAVGFHIEEGPDGGVISLDDTSILDAAQAILGENKKQE